MTCSYCHKDTIIWVAGQLVCTSEECNPQTYASSTTLKLSKAIAKNVRQENSKLEKRLKSQRKCHESRNTIW